MLIQKKPSWFIPEHKATPESVYVNRRQILAAMGFGLAGGLGILPSMAPSTAAAAISGFPAQRNPAYTLDRDISPEEEATTYTNFYEFGSSKNIFRQAQRLRTDPWKVKIRGMVEEKITIDAEDLIAKLGDQEERLYRHRCVETWAMAVPWTGVPLAKLVQLAKPLPEAKYLRFETFHDPDIAPGQRQSWYPWPYVEGITIEEAQNELPFLATGIYGKPMPNQNGAPLRLVLPWKYGFKSIKSITRISFTDKRPVSFWEELQAREYGFWANVNPNFDHPRWSQATERMLGSDERIPTLLYNGYADQVAHLYADMPQTRDLFF
ncbi:MAG: mononuclear molybdenum enzyme YedY [Candidatus Puniceispirillum sp. TMED52]|nr:protein-methionine-sulfoxide reductase catalytic subunit MsrP [SAR116 cluster bacterium]OUU52966.1 MAG: mononuclear molybdenum enzyme YedY [Candidatus Puniceispirillum sp. TMED52]